MKKMVYGSWQMHKQMKYYTLATKKKKLVTLYVSIDREVIKMTKTNFDFFKRNLNGYIVTWETEDGFYTNTVFVLAPEGEYKITKNTANDTYSVEYIPNFGSHEFSVHITMSDAIDYIKDI